MAAAAPDLPDRDPPDPSAAAAANQAVANAVESAIGVGFGEDTEGREYAHIAQMWNAELGAAGERLHRWYGGGEEYWEADEVPATVDGVLGGFSELDEPDVRASRALIAAVREARPQLGRARALDCGAGIGRVTRNTLLPEFDAVEVVEPSRKLLAAMPAYLSPPLAARVTAQHHCGMQAFDPREAAEPFDAIWAQWVVGHLTDGDLVAWVQRCLQALRPGAGVLVVKENVCAPMAFVIDKDDSSITRSRDYFVALFEQAGATLFAEQEQPDFPRGMYRVISFVLV